MKVKALDPRSVAAARAVLDGADVRHARDIHVEAIAARHRAMVLYGEQATARGSIVRAGRVAVIRVDERAAGRPWARFTIAHELGHHLLHDLVDHFMQCVDEEAKRGESAWRVEREASDFAAELLIPERLGAPLCDHAAPRADDVAHLARTFNTSFEMSAIRMVQLTRAPCAAVLTVNGKIKWAAESAAFPGKIVMRRAVHRESAAARLAGMRRGRGDHVEREVRGDAWGGAGDSAMVESAMRAGEGRVLSWIGTAG